MDMGKALNQPINPFIFAVIGLSTIFYGLYLLVPKVNAYTLITYTLFEDYYFDVIFSTAGIMAGLWVFLAPKIANRISKMIAPLYFMSIYWLTIGVFIFIGDWHSNSWIIPFCLAALCIIGAANYSVNRDSAEYEKMMQK